MSDPSAQEIALFSSGFSVLAALIPVAAEALKGGASVEEAIAAARKAEPPAFDTRAEDAARRARLRAAALRLRQSTLPPLGENVGAAIDELLDEHAPGEPGEHALPAPAAAGEQSRHEQESTL